jgi:hypothetical protein
MLHLHACQCGKPGLLFFLYVSRFVSLSLFSSRSAMFQPSLPSRFNGLGIPFKNVFLRPSPVKKTHSGPNMRILSLSPSARP